MIRVDVVNVFMTEKDGEFVVLLKGEGDPRTLPISIGQQEAQSIAMELYHTVFPRPLTHDLFKKSLESIGAKVTKAVICDLIDRTFFAKLFLETAGRATELDARPSDAIAMTLRFAAPVYVEEKVMDSSGVVFPSQKKSKGAEKTPPKPARKKETHEKPPLDALKTRLEEAVRKEQYEEAAKLRDEIGKLTKPN